MNEVRVVLEGLKQDLPVSSVKAMNLNHWPGWDCTVGLHCLYIDFDGMVWRGPCRVGGTLGSMLTDWEIPEVMIQCTRSSCDCGTGIKLPKRVNSENYVLPLQTQPFQVQWDLGRRCNFDCSYCWPSSHNKTDEWTDIEELLSVVQRIHSLYSESHGAIQFNFAGGEPTLHPDFRTLCLRIKALGHNIHIQTNGTMNSYMARELARIAEISISVHFEQANIRKILLNIESMLDEDAKLEVKMMVPPNSFDKMEEFCDGFKQVPNYRKARLIASPLRDPKTNKLMDYTDKQLKRFGDVWL